MEDTLYLLSHSWKITHYLSVADRVAPDAQGRPTLSAGPQATGTNL